MKLSRGTFYKAQICYLGRSYYGWQKQVNEKTIQGELEKAINLVSKGALINSIGSGRTDAGVHALSQIIRLEMSSEFPDSMFLNGVNNYLPNEIRLMDIEKCDENFHPVFSAKKKTYKYFISNKNMSPFLDGMYTYYPKKIDLELLVTAVKLFEGTHSFFNYYCKGTDIKSFERTIFDAKVFSTEYLDLINCRVESTLTCFEFTGNGFLKQMVRLMVGALMALNEGKITLEDIQNSLVTPRNNKLGVTSSPEGLYLCEVMY